MVSPDKDQDKFWCYYHDTDHHPPKYQNENFCFKLQLFVPVSTNLPSGTEPFFQLKSVADDVMKAWFCQQFGGTLYSSEHDSNVITDPTKTSSTPTNTRTVLQSLYVLPNAYA
jgi:hypothetical protein